MTRWRPRPLIRVIAIGLHWRAGRLLAAEVLDDAGYVKGYRPLGGGVDFGEPWREALRREFREELDIPITVDGPPLVLENIYRHEGALGHEVVFAADVTFPQGAFDGQDVLTFAEDNGVICTARWVDPWDLPVAGAVLYPDGLADALDVRGRRR